MRTLKEKLSAKLKKNGGFTLVEMLVVVAIIAILIAISIPMVGSALEKARDATDDANFRDAAALGNIMLLTEDNPDGTYFYVTNASAQGVLKEGTGTGKDEAPTDAYTSQCTATTASSDHGKTGTSAGKHIKVVINKGAADILDQVKVTWA